MEAVRKCECLELKSGLEVPSMAELSRHGTRNKTRGRKLETNKLRNLLKTLNRKRQKTVHTVSGKAKADQRGLHTLNRAGHT